MKCFASILIAAGVVLVLPAASATPSLQSFAANGSTAVFNCPWNSAHTTCNWSQFQSYNGATISAASISSVTEDARGKAAVSAEISATSYLPSLHAYAYSNPAATGAPGAPYGGASRADANVWGVQGYRYTGDTAFLLTMTATLDSIFANTAQSARNGNHSGFRVSIFDTAGYAFAYSDVNNQSDEMCPIMQAAPLRFCTAMPQVYAFGSKTLQDTGSISTTLSYLLQPGQAFYVGAFLDASVCCGATVDSSHTLNLLFNDANNLDSVAVPGAFVDVPEPASLPLTALGVALLFGLRRRALARK